MPAQSQQQQKLFGLALAVKRGEVPASEVSDEVRDIVDRMSEKDIEDFAGTKHAGLPAKVEAQLREIVREIMRERAITELEEAYKGNMSDFKYEFPLKFVEETGNPEKAIKKISKKGKGYEVRTSIYMSEPEMKKVGDAMGLKLVNYQKSSNIAVTLYESQLPNAMIPSNIKAKLNMAIDKIKDTNLTYNQKLQVIGKIINGLGIDKKELVKMSTRLRGTLESVNEDASRTAMEIGGLTGITKYAIQKFVDDNNLDIEKVFQFVKKGKLKDRLDFGTAVVGKPNNPIQKKMIKMFSESVNEGKKRFYQQDGIGKAKYTISYHDGVKTHRDGSDFYDIKIFKNKKDLEKFRTALLKKGYREDSGFKKESVNEGASTEEKRIVMMAVKKIAKYRNVPLNYAVGDVMRAAQELERDIKKGKIK